MSSVLQRTVALVSASVTTRSGSGFHTNLIRTLKSDYPRIYEKHKHSIDFRQSGLHHLVGKPSVRSYAYEANADYEKARKAKAYNWQVSCKLLCYGKPKCLHCSKSTGSAFSKAEARLCPWPRFCSFLCSKRAESVTQKRRQTVLATYGVDNVSYSSVVLDKLKSAWDEGARAAQSERSTSYWSSLSTNAGAKIQKKREATYLRKTGYRFPSQNPDARQKAVQTWQHRLGVDNPSRSLDVMAKIATSWKKSKSLRIQRKTFVGLQGYEPEALEFLVANNVPAKHILNGKSTLAIPYRDRTLGKDRVYFPDFVMTHKEDKTWVVEVKSTYTAGLHGDTTDGKGCFQNLKDKAQAVVKSGYSYLLLVKVADTFLPYTGVPSRKDLQRKVNKLRERGLAA